MRILMIALKMTSVKLMFKHELQKGREKLAEDIKKRFEQDEEQFRKDIKETIKQFEERIKDSLVMLERINIDSGFDPNFNIHSGIDKLGLFSSVGGLALILFAPIVGEIALAAGVVLGAIGIVKSVWSWFSSDYKKSQQKKEVDKNLDKVCEIIEERVRNQIEDAKKGICEKVEKLKANLRPVDNYKRMKRQLKEAHEKLGYISHNINLTISKQGACNEE